MENFKISLAAARVNAKLSQAELAKRMGVTKQTVLNWESGRVKPKMYQLISFCSVCNVPIDAIFLP